MKFNTKLLRYGILRSLYNEHSESLYLTSSFCFNNSYEAEWFFKNSFNYNIYSRFGNPSLEILQRKISNIENCRYSLILSSGMSCLVSILIVFIKSGENFIFSRNLFSANINFFIYILYKFNIFCKFINSLNINLLHKNISNLTKLIFIETPSNPLMEIFDINLISYFSKKFNILLIIDNTFLTPVLQNPVNFGADIIIHSCTKFLDGQGRVLAGSLTSNNQNLIKQIYNFIRLTGFIVSIFNAWIISRSLETLSIRIVFQIKNSLNLIKLFNKNFFIFNIFYPGYNSFYNKLVYLQQILGGSIITFNIKGIDFENQRINSWKLLNNLNLIMVTANLGDIRTNVTHPSTTTHNSFNFFEKLLLTISESMVRISLGLDDIHDLYNDFYIKFNKILQ